MFDVIVFGSATLDISLSMPTVKIKKETDLIVDKGLLLNLGSKIEVDKINVSFGGGGMNTSTTFANQDLNVAYCGSIGNDESGEGIMNYLKKKKIKTSFIKTINGGKTNTSIILNIPQKDRTILVYRGASDSLSKNDIQWPKLIAKWFYLAPLSGKLSSLTDDILLFAKKKNIKTAINLGNDQLAFSEKRMKLILDTADVVIMNLEEASVLTDINYNYEKDIIEKIAERRKKVTVVTKGERGVSVIHNDIVYEAKIKKVKPIDNTGAGDAFGSGFISSLIEEEENMEMAIKKGLLNSKSCLSQVGSVNGLLPKDCKKLIEKENIKVTRHSL
jgi:ribokinase